MEVPEITREQVFQKVAKKFKTPAYVYFEEDLVRNLDQFMNIPAPFGKRVRFAMKANPNAAVLRVFDEKGAHFDASSFNEVLRAMDPRKGKAGIAGSKISLTSQEVQTPERLRFLARHGVSYTAGSLEQLRTFGETLPGTEEKKRGVGIRFNTEIGSGWNGHTNTGGEGAPFGIYEQREKIDALLEQYNLSLNTVHLHIGSGSDPAEQIKAIKAGLAIAKDYESVKTLNLGGGFKVGRMPDEPTTDIAEMGRIISQALTEFERDTGRKLELEVEPGTALVANAGSIVQKIIDKIPGAEDSVILKVDGGMHVNPRPSMYGAQHGLDVSTGKQGDVTIVKTFVYGKNCESGDTLTPKLGNPGEVEARDLPEAEIGDLLIMHGSGAYTSSMKSNYNSLENAAEILVRKDGRLDLVSPRQRARTIWERDRVPRDLRNNLHFRSVRNLRRRYEERRLAA